MHLGLREGLEGRRRKIAICPACSSDRARYSRRHYEGIAFILFRVRPVKCSDCGVYFPIAQDGSIPNPQRDPVDLHIPFRPSELDTTVEDGEEGRVLSGACPVCGSEDVRPSRPESNPSLASRLDVETTYRCVACNASFRRTSPARVLFLSVILLAVLGGLGYLILSVLGSRGQRNLSPRIRKDQVKEPPPPVFR